MRKIHKVIDRNTLEQRIVVYGTEDTTIRDPKTFCLYKGKTYSYTRMKEILFLNHLLTRCGQEDMSVEEAEFALTDIFGTYGGN